METNKTNRIKRIASVVSIIALTLLVCIKIWYVNAYQYRTMPMQSYSVGEPFYYKDIEFCVSSYDIYNAEKLSKAFSDEILEFCDDKNILISVRIKNTADDDKDIDFTAFSIKYDYLNGGGINPYLFQFINSNLATNRKIRANEETFVILPFPYSHREARLIFALYPRQIIVTL